jgi:voltage-gated potassium channel
MLFTVPTESLPFQRLLKGMYWLLTVIAAGTIGYCVVEDWSIAAGFFMTVLTMSTVGYGKTHQLSEAGRRFTSGLIFVSLISITGWAATLTSFIVECDLGGHFQHRRIARMISTLTGPTIVCGSGLMAQADIERLARNSLTWL